MSERIEMPKFPSAANVASVVRKYDGVKFANEENLSAADSVKDVMIYGLSAGVCLLFP